MSKFLQVCREHAIREVEQARKEQRQPSSVDFLLSLSDDDFDVLDTTMTLVKQIKRTAKKFPRP